MANRLGLLDPASLTKPEKELYDLMARATSRNRNKFVIRDEKDRFVGPFGIQLHTPSTGMAFMAMAGSLLAIPGLPPDARETAILVVGARTGAAYENYAHSITSGFGKEELESIRAGRCPERFSRPQQIAFEVATELGGKGPLKKEVWDEAVNVLGKSGATALVHFVGLYSYVATILNGFDAEVPVSAKL